MTASDDQAVGMGFVSGKTFNDEGGRQVKTLVMRSWIGRWTAAKARGCHCEGHMDDEEEHVWFIAISISIYTSIASSVLSER